MRSEKVHGFVLSTLDYGESDRIVSLFTLEHGRIKGFARAARNSRKRFGPALEHFAQIEAALHLKEPLSTLQSCDVLSLYPAIRGDIYQIALALYSCELLDVLAPEGHPFPRIFRLFAAWLDKLESGSVTKGDRRFFEINLLNILGYRPEISQCGRCGEPYSSFGAIVQNTGELLCHICGRTGVKISEESLILMRYSLATGTFGKIIFSPNTETEVGKVMDLCLTAHAGKKFKSLDFLNQVS